MTTPRAALSLAYGPMKLFPLMITAYPLVTHTEGSMNVACLAGVPYGRTGVFGLTAGCPGGSFSNDRSSALEM